jgi:poly(3-hydroxybutyrate) depolymerase
VNPGRVNRFADRVSEMVVHQTSIHTVQWPHRGAGRRVHPGFMQVGGFIGMNPRRHVAAFGGLLRDVMGGGETAAERTKTFYDEYLAVLDVTAEFYLDTLKVIFTEHHMARGSMTWHRRPVNRRRSRARC